MSIKTWFAEHLNPKYWSVKTRVVVASVTALALAGGGVGAAFALRSPAAPVASPSSTPTAASPTPTPTPMPVPRTAASDGTINGWTLADATVFALVAPQVGDAADGEVALEIDAPVVQRPGPAARTTAMVRPNTDYTLSMAVRVLEPLPQKVAATLRIGDTGYPIPEMAADWQTVEVTYRTGVEETQAEVSVYVEGPVRGLSVDAVSLRDNAGAESVLNGSFEELQVEWGIRNRSLIMQQQTAALAVRMAGGEALWRATRKDGRTVEGRAVIGAGLSAVPLEGLDQGYYTVTLTDSTGGSITAPVGIVRMPTRTIPVDSRLGVQVHAQRPYHEGGASAAASVGLGMMRTDDDWHVTESTRGYYGANPVVVRAFAEAAALGVERLLIVGRTNPLYDENRTPYTEQGVAAYGRYARALAKLYDLTAIEVYNEFNIPGFNKGPCGLNAACYAPLLKSAYEGIKAIKPNLPVVGGVTGNYDSAWLEELWQSGGLAHLDVVSFHPYQVYQEPEALAQIIDDARKVMSNYGTPKSVWVTELGWTTKTGGVSLEQQAEMVIRSEVAALAGGASRFLWYNLANDGSNPAAHEENFGQFMPKAPGVAAFPPKPAAFTQALFISSLAGKEVSGVDDFGVAGVTSVKFASDEETVRYAWATKGSPEVEYAATGPITVTTAHGEESVIQPVGGKVRVKLSGTPLILTGAFDAG